MITRWMWLCLVPFLLASPAPAQTFTEANTTGIQTLTNKTITNSNVNGVFNVMAPPYNAKGAPADDTAAIQAAFNACIAAQSGEIDFPQGSYNHTGLMLAPASSQIHCNLRGLGGAGAFGVTLNYTGTGGTGLTITNNTRYRVDNLVLTNTGTGATGLLLTSLAAGSNHGPATFTNVRINGFTTNLQIGETSGKAASELTFNNFETSNATTCVLIQGPTASQSFVTDIHFTQYLSASCPTSLKVAGWNGDNQNKVTIVGGSLTDNGLDFDFQVPGTYVLYGIRSEQGGATNGQFIRSGSATATQNSALPTHVTLDSVYTSFPSSPSNFVALFYQPGEYAVRETTLQTGSIQLGGFDGGGGARKSSLIVEGSTIVSGSARIAYKASSNTIWLVRHYASSTANVEALNTDDDRTYLIQTTGTEINLSQIPWSSSTTTLATMTGPIPPTLTFSALGTPPNGTMLYCSDCTVANPCAAVGNGAFAKRLNGVWVCN
jgi:hypothetical protein